MSDQETIDFAVKELVDLKIIKREVVRDAKVYRIPKAYPAYFGSYNKLDEIREYTNGFQNLFLIGRNGMHKYNNQDHSMLSAMTAVDNIIKGSTDKSNIWNINTESAYHESGDIEKES